MENNILGLHHITAIAGDAQRNYDFYTRVMGLRLVKKTVNFDDPGTYHFYFGDEVGTPGTILTFFPWVGIAPGRTGTGMATEIGYAVPAGSLEFWQDRFLRTNTVQGERVQRFGEDILPFQDPDGLQLNLVVPKTADGRTPWQTGEVTANVATRGFHNITLTLRKMDATARILTDIFGYRLLAQEGNRYRFVTDAVPTAQVVDIVEAPNEQPGHVVGGTNHHVAFRVKDDNVLMEFREKVARQGHGITPKIDRDYFYSLYFREPGGVLFEIATDNPGFTRDEAVGELGSGLKLPARYEAHRREIENILPAIS
ncbi:ring-cleaving dioxygenase [Paraflavisolibacter sp. H34]|uniref:ring-cleaving dioxygenase n=1 Tax=Huijunlia imazamoxiresistens TaxID=3127457 RepID=UPI0030176450